ncbi:MAG: hypothetical protein AB9835_01085 [Eubacteriales bacterium]
MIKIEDRSDIKRIINYINSLELIEEFPRVEYFPNSYKNATIRITVFKTRYDEYGENFDGFVFQNEYMSFTPSILDWESKVYYVENSKYDSNTKTSTTYNFLYDYISKTA